MNITEAYWSTSGIFALMAFIFTAAATYPGWDPETLYVRIRLVVWALAVVTFIAATSFMFMAVWSNVR